MKRLIESIEKKKREDIERNKKNKLNPHSTPFRV